MLLPMSSTESVKELYEFEIILHGYDGELFHGRKLSKSEDYKWLIKWLIAYHYQSLTPIFGIRGRHDWRAINTYIVQCHTLHQNEWNIASKIVLKHFFFYCRKVLFISLKKQFKKMKSFSVAIFVTFFIVALGEKIRFDKYDTGIQLKWKMKSNWMYYVSLKLTQMEFCFEWYRSQWVKALISLYLRTNLLIS